MLNFTLISFDSNIIYNLINIHLPHWEFLHVWWEHQRIPQQYTKAYFCMGSWSEVGKTTHNKGNTNVISKTNERKLWIQCLYLCIVWHLRDQLFFSSIHLFVLSHLILVYNLWAVSISRLRRVGFNTVPWELPLSPDSVASVPADYPPV